MSLIKCPECQKEISYTAIACPNCGCPIVSKENKQKQTKAMQKVKIYQTAFTHFAIIAIMAFVIRITDDIRVVIMNRVGITLSKLWFTRSMEMSSLRLSQEFFYIRNMNVIFLILLIVVILWLVKCHKSNIKISDTHKTSLLIWSIYIILHNIFAVTYILEYNDFLTWFLCLTPVLLIAGILLYAKVKLKLKIEVSKYKSIFAIYGIYTTLNIILDCTTYYGGFYTWSSITIIIMPILMGIMWCFSGNKSKTI